MTVTDNNKEEVSNIFDDFNDDSTLLDEIEQIKDERNKDIFYYMEKIGKYFQVIFIILLLLSSIAYGYIFIQNKVFTENKDSQVLNPICFILLDNIHYDGNFCTSVSTLKNEYTIELENLEKKQADSILNISNKLYTIENFTKTKEVVFLQDKTANKLKTLEILSAFDDLKNKFDNVDKEKIQCDNLEINNTNKILSMDCIAYSAGYEKGIRGFDGKNDIKSLVKGTSLSIANSFLNYINLESNIFIIIDRQKIFKSENIIGNKTGFTSKTRFNLKLKFNL